MAGQFHHLVTHSAPSWPHRWKAVREGLLLPFRPDAGDVDRIPALPPGPPPVPADGQAVVTWVGHASFLIQVAGLNILTDPVWSERLPGRIPRLRPPGVPWGELPPIDAVVVSHNHYDHMDTRTLERLPRSVHLFVPLGMARWFLRRGFRHVHALHWWQSVKLGGTEFEFVPAHHWSRRRVMDKNDSLWGGWVILPPGSGGIYFAGDTGYGGAFKAIRHRHPHLEVALVPIGAYTPRWHEHGVHLNPFEAVQAFQDLGAATMVPMHWATFPMAPEPVLEPHALLLEAWEASGLAGDRLADLPIGASYAWHPGHTPGLPAPQRPEPQPDWLAAPRRLWKRIATRMGRPVRAEPVATNA